MNHSHYPSFHTIAKKNIYFIEIGIWCMLFYKGLQPSIYVHSTLYLLHFNTIPHSSIVFSMFRSKSFCSIIGYCYKPQRKFANFYLFRYIIIINCFSDIPKNFIKLVILLQILCMRQINNFVSNRGDLIIYFILGIKKVLLNIVING